MTAERFEALAKLFRECAKDSVCRSLGVAGCGDPDCSATRAYIAANELEVEAHLIRMDEPEPDTA